MTPLGWTGVAAAVVVTAAGLFAAAAWRWARRYSQAGGS